jgi:hypothetical protein
MATAAAQSTIYKCVKNGQVTLTDQPCDGKPRDPAPFASQGGNEDTQAGKSRPLDSPMGTWHGNVTAELTVSGKSQPIMPPAGTLVFAIAADGTVSGSLQNGSCTLSGKVTGEYSRGDRALDVALTRCSPTQLNMRYSGDIRIGAIGAPAHLALSGLSGFTQGKNENTATLKAELVRDVSKPH